MRYLWPRPSQDLSAGAFTVEIHAAETEIHTFDIVCEGERQHCRQLFQSLQSGTVLLQKGAGWAVSSCPKEFDQTHHFLWSGETT